MTNEKFKVIYKGKLKEGYDINQVSVQFAIKFKLTPDKALKILQSRGERVLNKQVEHVKAYKLKSIFEDMGMQVRLERLTIISAPLEATKAESATENSDDAEKEASGSTGSITTSDSWTMDPINKEPENSNQETIQSDNNSVQESAQIQDNNTRQVTDGKVEIEYNNDSMMDKIKKYGGVGAAVVAGLLFVLKKFGLFKLLKIGLLVTAVSFAGFESEELCMGNSECEDAIDEQLDMCWYDKGFEDYNWENMSDEEYNQIKPRLENEVIACFTYEDTGEKIFISPIEIRFDVMDLCYYSEIDDCEKIIEPQIKACYESNNIAQYVSAETTDYASVVYNNQNVFENFYTCFKDNDGNTLVEVDFSEDY